METEFWAEVGEWADKTFNHCDALGALEHLKEEVDEVIKEPTDRFEYADCLTLIIDAARRAGIPYPELMKTVKEKYEINKNRKWENNRHVK